MLSTLSILSLDQGPKWTEPQQPDPAPLATPQADAWVHRILIALTYRRRTA